MHYKIARGSNHGKGFIYNLAESSLRWRVALEGDANLEEAEPHPYIKYQSGSWCYVADQLVKLAPPRGTLFHSSLLIHIWDLYFQEICVQELWQDHQTTHDNYRLGHHLLRMELYEAIQIYFC